MKRFLNVGPSKELPVPDYYREWTHELASIEPDSGADHAVDPRDLSKLPAGGYDAVYCAHVLEHFYPHDGQRVFAGVVHVLKPDGFAEFRTINLAAVMKHAVEKNLDLNDALYESDAGSVTVKDAIYGFGDDEGGDDEGYVHRTGFTPKRLAELLTAAGFARVVVAVYGFNLLAYAFRQEPSAEQKAMLHLPS
jgi:hypothetical protein